MAINASFPIVEEGNGSPHGEVFRLVYNFQDDACGDQVVIPMGGVPYWDFTQLVADQYPFGINVPPAAPRAATNVAEAYVAATGFPVGGHQDNQGVAEYAAVGVSQLAQRAALLIGMPAGVCVVDNMAAITHGYPGVFETYVDRCYMVKTRGIVQTLVEGTAAIAVGDYLEGVAGQWYLVVDAANANEGTFIALEAYAVAAAALIWTMIVNVNY